MEEIRKGLTLEYAKEKREKLLAELKSDEHYDQTETSAPACLFCYRSLTHLCRYIWDRCTFRIRADDAIVCCCLGIVG